jgi:molybdopterin converting factor small subunit
MMIHVFASLKEYMPAQFELSGRSIITVQQLQQLLQERYPEASEVLAACRFSTEKEIISLSQEIKDYDNIFVIPPSSGG